MATNRGDPTQAFWAKKFVAGSGTAIAPSISFNADPDTGFYLDGAATLRLSVGGASTFVWYANTFTGLLTNSGALLNETVSSSNPTLLPAQNDLDTGIGSAGADKLNLIAGGNNAMQFTEVSNHVLIAYPSGVHSAITAHAGGGQASALQLIRPFSIITISATNGDSVKLPAAFAPGTVMEIINADAAQTVDVFPGIGDDLGAGANNAINIIAGESIKFVAIAENTTWAKIGGST